MKDFTGKRYERLIVEKFAYIKRFSSPRNTQTKSYWHCKCDCGNKTIVSGEALAQKRQFSCGCLAREKSATRLRTHGKSSTPTYQSWVSMKSRVNSNDPHHRKYYGDTKVCERWDKFKNFLDDMGERPGLNYSLDRVNPNGDYEPRNCRWLTHAQQMQNQRRNHEDYQYFLSLNPVVPRNVYWQRVNKLGWSKIKAATTPKMKNQYG